MKQHIFSSLQKISSCFPILCPNTFWPWNMLLKFRGLKEAPSPPPKQPLAGALLWSVCVCWGAAPASPPCFLTHFHQASLDLFFSSPCPQKQHIAAGRRPNKHHLDSSSPAPFSGGGGEGETPRPRSLPQRGRHAFPRGRHAISRRAEEEGIFLKRICISFLSPL